LKVVFPQLLPTTYLIKQTKNSSSRSLLPQFNHSFNYHDVALRSRYKSHINPMRLNQIMPTLQQMEDPTFLKRQRHHFNNDYDPPPPYPSGSTTQLPTPNLVNDVDIDELLHKPFSDEAIHLPRQHRWKYHPHRRYNDEVRQEHARIHRETLWGVLSNRGLWT